jgi:hypothetical protein
LTRYGIVPGRSHTSGGGPTAIRTARGEYICTRGGARFSAWPWSRQGGGAPTASGSSTSTQTLRLRGRQLLDFDGLACLLILLFVDDVKLNVNRLHRVLRNLCYHQPTRDWIVSSLLAMLQVTKSPSSPVTSGSVQVPALPAPDGDKDDKEVEASHNAGVPATGTKHRSYQ